MKRYDHKLSLKELSTANERVRELESTQFPKGWHFSIPVHCAKDTFGEMLDAIVGDVGYSDKGIVLDSPELDALVRSYDAQIAELEAENVRLREQVVKMEDRNNNRWQGDKDAD
jgi:hypothetical protein